jgi:hypothetical protein
MERTRVMATVTASTATVTASMAIVLAPLTQAGDEAEALEAIAGVAGGVAEMSRDLPMRDRRRWLANAKIQIRLHEVTTTGARNERRRWPGECS